MNVPSAVSVTPTYSGVPRLLARWLANRHFTLSLIVVALILTSPALAVGLQFDDYLQQTVIQTAPNPTTAIQNLFVFMDGNASHTQEKMAAGQFPWYTLPEGKVAFWRPLAGLTTWADYALWPNQIWLMHLQNLGWYVLLVIVVTQLYHSLLPLASPQTPGPIIVANLAALLYALDDAHGFAIAWLANRNALMAATFGLLALLYHHRWRISVWRPGSVLAPICLILALLAGESAVATLAYLLAYALTLDKGSPFQRLLTLLPATGVLIVWRTAYIAQGFGSWGTAYIDPGKEPLRFIWAIFERVPILLLGQWAFPPAELFAYVAGLPALVYWLLAVGILGLLCLGLRPLIRKLPLARFFALGMLLASLPAAAALPANRLLLFVGFGAFGLLSLFIGQATASPTAKYQSLGSQWLLGINLLQIPLLALTAFSPFLLGNIEPSLATLPTERTFAQQTAVFVNAPSHFYIAYLPDIRRGTSQPMPAHLLFLAPGTSTIYVSRKDPDTLEVEPKNGFMFGFDQVFRAPTAPFVVGQQIQLPEVSIKILALTPDQLPAKAAFHFTEPLEDSSLRWLQWQNGQYIPFAVPAIGQSLVLEPAIQLP